MTCNGSYTCGKCAKFLNLVNTVKEAQSECDHKNKSHYKNGAIQCDDCGSYLSSPDASIKL